MDISNPLFRESIIAMDGQIVRPRVRTLAQAAALTPRANVLMFKDDSVDEYYFPRALLEANGALLQKIIIPIGDWNMDADATANVIHGLGGEWKNIREMSVIIRNDGDSTYYFCPMGTVFHAVALTIADFDAVDIRIVRQAGSDFDDPDFNSVGYNRGWVTIGIFV